LSVTTFVVADPPGFVNTASYFRPFSATVAAKLSVVEVAPDTAVHVVPPLVDTRHCTLGVGAPLAAALKVAVDPGLTVSLLGCVVTLGATSFTTVTVAADVVAVPATFVNTARTSHPFSVVVSDALVTLGDVAPEPE
jgi:hypothetical protein